VPEEQIEQSVYDVLISTSRNEPIKMTEILWQISDKLELAPASIDLAAFEQQMAGINEREDCLREALADMKENYDYAIIDCPPAVGLLTFNALRAATEVVVPVETGYFALHGLSKQLETLSILCRRSGQQVNVRVLASMYDIRTKMAREILADLRSRFGDKMFDTIICFNTKIKEASSFGQPISEYDSASKGRRDFSALADEILGVEAKQQRNEFVNSLADQLESISASADELLQAAKPPVKVEPLQIEQPETDLREEELILVEEPVELALGEEIEVAEEQTSEEPLPAAVQEVETQQKSTAVKLSEYYGVTQLNDAVVFVTLYPRAHSVQIAGDFNNWQPEHHIMEKVGESGVWQTQMKLDPGRYRYRLVVDSQWQQDPYNELTELNPFGGFNSVIEVK
jgi:chromosome partitioning protein